MLFGLLAAIQFIVPGFLFEILDFSVNRMVHINAMVVWMLYGFIGSVYWFLEEESGTEIAGLKLGEDRLLCADWRGDHRGAGLPADPDRAGQGLHHLVY